MPAKEELLLALLAIQQELKLVSSQLQQPGFHTWQNALKICQ